jgi:hypothetical protein
MTPNKKQQPTAAASTPTSTSTPAPAAGAGSGSEEPLLRLKIPRLSKGVIGAMKNAGDVVLNGGSPDIESIVDDGMSFPTNDIDKVG